MIELTLDAGPIGSAADTIRMDTDYTDTAV